jgi:hypothetical protein
MTWVSFTETSNHPISRLESATEAGAFLCTISDYRGNSKTTTVNFDKRVTVLVRFEALQGQIMFLALNKNG